MFKQMPKAFMGTLKSLNSWMSSDSIGIRESGT